MNGDLKEQLKHQDNLAAKLVLIEEHASVRTALGKRLSDLPHLEVVETRPFLPTGPQEIVSMAPDLVLIGRPQKNLSRTEILFNQIKYWKTHQIETLILASFIDPIERESLLDAGASAYILKSINSLEMIKTIDLIQRERQTLKGFILTGG